MIFSAIFSEKDFYFLKNHIDKLNKKLIVKKYSSIEMTYSTIIEPMKAQMSFETQLFETKYKVIIKQEDIIINDWNFLACCDYSFKEVLIVPINDNVIKKEWYSNNNICDHCNTTRKRKLTYILENKNTNEIKFVGSTCIKEFCVFSKNYYLDFSIWFNKFIKSLEFNVSSENEENFSFSSSQIKYSVKNILIITAGLIRKTGSFVKSSEEFSTKNQFFTFMSFAGERFKILDCDIKNAENSLDFINNLNDDSNFTRTLKLLINEYYVNSKYVSFICAAMSIYLKSIKEKIEISNTFFGEIGKRYKNQKVTLITAKFFERDFYNNYRYILTFKNENNEILVWFCSNPSENIINGIDQLFISDFTIKNFNEFNGKNQTIITRMKIYENN